ncbi:MAG: hypothetical protein H7834_06370 [Magnetococcus sp. YQC-9]
MQPDKPQPAWNVQFLLVKKREGLGDSSPRVLTLTLILERSSKEAFFAPFAKNAPRAAFAGVVFCLLETTLCILHAALRKTTHPKMGAVYLRYAINATG